MFERLPVVIPYDPDWEQEHRAWQHVRSGHGLCAATSPPVVLPGYDVLSVATACLCLTLQRPSQAASHGIPWPALVHALLPSCYRLC